MLKSLRIRHFTVFAEAEFEFSPGLNVIVGTNGTGKSHVLKLGYSVVRAGAKIWSEGEASQNARSWQIKLARRLADVFQPEGLGKLVRRSFKQAHIQAEFLGEVSAKIDFSFSSSAALPSPAGRPLLAVKEFPKGLALAATVFIPPKEVLTMYWLREQYDLRIIPVDSTYPALLYLLGSPASRKLSRTTSAALVVLERILEGQVEQENDGGKFYLASPKQGRIEMNLVAEGVRKFGMLEKLLRNGSLTVRNTLFWDEPEANLNPTLLRKLAALLVELSRQGFQIILATHSLFLLKEFHILSQREATPVRYFGLFEGPAGDTQVETTDDFETLEHIAALDAELEQTVDFQQALDQDDAS